jgi:hypothetical protein
MTDGDRVIVGDRFALDACARSESHAESATGQRKDSDMSMSTNRISVVSRGLAAGGCGDLQPATHVQLRSTAGLFARPRVAKTFSMLGLGLSLLLGGCSEHGEGDRAASADGSLDSQVTASTDTGATAQQCKTLGDYVGGGKINIVDFTATTGGASSPFKFRLKFDTIETTPPDGFFGAIVNGNMTFSYPRQANPELPYVPSDPYPANYLHGPAFGETVAYQAREVACNVFEIHWKEPRKGDTVTHVEDFGRNQVCTNITNINRAPIPSSFDPLDLAHQLNDTALFPAGSPLNDPNFGFFPLCGTMSQSLESDRVWEMLNYLVYTDS